MDAMINGINLHYVDTGPRDALPVVFLHAFPLNHLSWHSQMLALQDRYRVVSYDVRGLGRSPDPIGQYTFEFFVDDLLGLLDHRQIQRAVLCGLSMGGYLALRAVERCPDRFRGLVLCDTRAESDSTEARLKRGEAIKAIRELGVKAYAEKFVRLAFAPETFDTQPEVIAQARAWIESNSASGICGALLAMATRTDTTAVLPGIRVPTLILVGEHDELTPPAVAEAMQTRIPNSVCHVIPSVGHMSNLENPDAFNARLREFLNELV